MKIIVGKEFWEVGDLIYVTSENNLNYQMIMECIEKEINGTARFCRFNEPEYNTMFINHTQKALDRVGIRITKEENPEYFL